MQHKGRSGCLARTRALLLASGHASCSRPAWGLPPTAAAVRGSRPERGKRRGGVRFCPSGGRRTWGLPSGSRRGAGSPQQRFLSVPDGSLLRLPGFLGQIPSRVAGAQSSFGKFPQETVQMALECWLFSACCLWISLEIRLLIPIRYSSRSNLPAASGMLGRKEPSGGRHPPGLCTRAFAAGGTWRVGMAEARVPAAVPTGGTAAAQRHEPAGRSLPPVPGLPRSSSRTTPAATGCSRGPGEVPTLWRGARLTPASDNLRQPPPRRAAGTLLPSGHQDTGDQAVLPGGPPCAAPPPPGPGVRRVLTCLSPASL